MSSLGSPNPLLFGGAKDYLIERSIRFDGSSSYFRKNDFSGDPDSKKIFTFSAWIKRSKVDDWFPIFGGHSGNSAFNMFGISSNDRLIWRIRNSSSSDLTRLESTRELRDPSSWYHLLLQRDSTQATAANRAKLWVNGEQITEWNQENTDEEDQEYSSDFLTDLHIGRGNINSSTNYYADGYMAEVYYIDGQALPPTSFGKTNPVTGQWIPIKYTGTYGTNGAYLNFSDNSNTTAATLGKDSSGNDNNFTPNNFSVASGEGNDSVTDSPTNNYCTWNPIDYIWGGFNNYQANNRLRQGALSTPNGSGKNSFMKGTFYVSSGKWYYECKGVGHGGDKIGWARSEDADGSEGSGSDHTTHHAYLSGNGEFQSNATTATPYGGTTYGGSIADGDVIGCAIDMDNNTVAWHNGGQWGDGSGNWDETYDNANKISISNKNWAPAYLDSSSSSGGDIHTNFGQQGFVHTPPTGFKALCTANLPEPTIKKASTNFNVVTYTGTGAEHAITGVGFSPDLVWTKGRSDSDNHSWFDTVRGATKELVSNSNGAEAADAQLLKSFDSDGFTLGTNAGVNGNTETYVAWNWKESASAGFDIVSYSGTGSAQTVSHSLGVAPEMMIIKNRDSTYHWAVYHHSLTDAAENHLVLSDNGGAAGGNTWWNDTAPTSSVFTVLSANETNKSGDDYIAYLFASVDGFSKFDYYKSQGGSDMSGEFVWTGFRPRWLMIKRRDSADAWAIYDSAREPTNELDAVFYAEDSMAEYTHSVLRLDFLSNGFKITGTSSILNTNDNIYLYAAWAEAPFKYANAR